MARPRQVFRGGGGALMVVVIYANIVQRLRFWYALACSLAILAMHIGGVLMVPAFNARLILPVISLVGATVVFTLMANYAMERDERKSYLLLLRQKQLLQALDDVHQRLQNLAHFKKYNDRYGHPAGDRCLVQVAEAMRACLRRPAAGLRHQSAPG